jgi:hypothetical protein
MSVPGPCIYCGATNYALSMGGPTICPSCDCGNFGAPTVTRQGKEIASLRTRIATLTAALAKCDAALGLTHGFVKEELGVRVSSHTGGGDMATLDADGIESCGEATDCLATIENAMRAAKEAIRGRHS